MKKFAFIAVALVAGLSISFAAEEEGKKGKGDPAKRAEMMLKAMDKDGSETVDAEEFAASKMAEKIKENRGEEAVGKLFGLFDKDGDGELTKKELASPPRGKGGKGGKGGDDGGGAKSPEFKRRKPSNPSRAEIDAADIPF